MNCPQCGDMLHNAATFCGCGWRKRKPPLVDDQEKHINCAHANCFLSAKVRIKTKTGWATLCMRHYDEHYAAQATANLVKWGLERLPGESQGEHTKRMREFVRGGFKRFSERRTA